MPQAQNMNQADRPKAYILEPKEEGSPPVILIIAGNEAFIIGAFEQREKLTDVFK